LPKSLAFANSLGFTKLAALPAYIFLKAFTPIQNIFKILVLEPVLRLSLGHKRRIDTIGAQEFRSLIESSRKQGFITADEKRLLREVIDIGLLKVRHVVRPRVDMIACDVTDSPDRVRETMCKHGLTKIPVYSGNIDSIAGVVHLRQILLDANLPLVECVRPVHFVPEQKTVVSLLEFFRQSETDIAVVVDEYGGIVGSVQLEDIAEELLGPVGQEQEDKEIKQIGPFEYCLPGSLAIHDWAGAFGIDIDETRVSTLGGLVTELLGHIPESGDVAHLRHLRFTVGKVQRHRIETLILSFQPNKGNGQ
jgi:CBS domain containing-hemolysin-like protein